MIRLPIFERMDEVMRCVHLNRVGEQCRGQVVAGSNLCAFHAGILEGRSASAWDERNDSTDRPKPLIPAIYRIAAALLLLIVFLEFAQTIRGWFR